MLCLRLRKKDVAHIAPANLRNLDENQARPQLTVTGLRILSKTRGRYDIDVTLANPSRAIQTVVLPPELSIESMPRAMAASHVSEFEMMPGQESTFAWSAQVDNVAIAQSMRIMQEVMTGEKTVTIRTYFKDSHGRWYTRRVLGRFSAGLFSTVGAPQSEPSPAPDAQGP